MKYSARLRARLSLTIMLAMWVGGLPVSASAYVERSASTNVPSNSTVAANAPAKLSAPNPVTEKRVRDAYKQIPISFEPNRGQLDPRVKFTARGGGYTMFLTATETVFVMRDKRPVGLEKLNAVKAATSVEALQQQVHSQTERKMARRQRELAARTVVRMKLSGANDDPVVVGADELQGRVNHFWTNNQKKWATDVPVYAKVQYKSVYPGIDMVYHGGGQQLEYDFVVSPGADPNVISLGFEGADQIEVNAEGDLQIHADGKMLRQQKPAVYQEINGIRQEVESSFVMKGKQVGFQLGSYDGARALIIDPVLSYSTFLGDENDEDNGFDIAVDQDGSAYVVGQTLGETFPTEDPYQSINADANYQAFVTKFNPAGSALVFSTYLGGTSDEAAYSVALDSDKNVYLTGYTDSVDFPRQNAMQQTCGAVVPGFFTLFQCEEDEAFVTKIAAAGNHLLFSTYLGGSAPDRGRGIAVDSSNNVYVTGLTLSFNFPTTHPIQPFINKAGNLQESKDSCCTADAFLTKIEPGGQFRVYSTFIGGAQDDVAMDVAVDSTGNAYLTGMTDSTHVNPGAIPTPTPNSPGVFPTTEGSFQPLPSNTGFTREAFVTKVNTAGDAYAFSTFLGGDQEDEAYGIAVGSDNTVFVTGYTDSSNYPTTENAYQLQNNGGYDAFITKLATNGASLLYSSYLGGEKDEGQGAETDFRDNNFDGAAIAVDFAGNAYVTGWTESTTVPLPPEPDTSCTGSFNYTDFSSIAGLTLNGSAAQSGDVLRLTPDATDQNGSAFYGTPVNGIADFTTTFGFKIAVTDETGAEGFAFNLTNNGPTTLPPLGEFGTSSDLSVSLQTFDAGNADTLRIFKDGSLLAITDVTGLNLDDGNAHSMTVASTGGTLSVNIDGAGTPAATAAVNFSTITPPMYVGFSARTGSTGGTDPHPYSETHDILNWSFSGSSTCPQPPVTPPLNFPVKNAVQPQPGSAPGESSRDAFVAKFNPNSGGADSLIYSTYLGGVQNDEGQGIAVDPAANAYVTGKTGPPPESCSCDEMNENAISASLVAPDEENDFPTTPGSYNPSKSDETNDVPDQDAFVTKIGGGGFNAHNTDTGFSIGGRVARPDTAPVPDVLVTLTRSDNSVAGTFITQADGVYSFDGLEPGVYTVTPSGGSGVNNSFTPPSRIVTITNQNERADFTATQRFSISGLVVDGNVAVGGVTLTLSGDASGTTVSDANGSYTFNNLPQGGNYTITPSSPFFTFTPPARTYNALDGTKTDAHFGVTRLAFSVSGRVTEGFTGLGGVTITVARTSDNSIVATTTTASDGTYTVAGIPAGGNYTVTPTLALYAFTPPSRTITNLAANQTSFDFAATKQRFAVSGRIATSSNSPVGGVTVTLSGDAAATTTTDSNGQYTFGNLTAGGNYTVTPSSPIFSFAPPSRTYNALSGNQTGADFVATRLTFSVSGRVTENVAGLGGVTITVTRSSDNSTVATTTTASDGTYTVSGLPAGDNYTVTPSLALYIFTPLNRTITNLVANQSNFDFAAARQRFIISGRIATSSNSPVSGVTVTLSGDAAATTTTDANGQYSFGNLEAGRNYTVTPSKPNFAFTPPTRTFNNLGGNQTGDFTAIPAAVTFTAAAAPGGPESTRNESDRSFRVTVNRAGDASGELVVEYATFDGAAQPAPSPAPPAAAERSDYITSIGRLHFAPGEMTKTITIFIIDDAFVEGNEALSLVLTSPSNGGVLGATSAVTLTIVDNDTTPPTHNPIDDPAFFVRQHYLDFLNREPESGGFSGWMYILNNCGVAVAQPCDRTEVSSAFFRSEEFQGRSFFAYRFYSTAFGRIPLYREMMRDLSFVTGFLSEEQLEANKQEFIEDFMSRPEFKNKYDPLTDPSAYVNELEHTAGVTLPNKQQLIDDLAAGRMTRAQVLRAIADSQQVKDKYFNQAFVVTEYFGYLKRNPDIAYLSWIQTLNQTGSYRTMVDGFLNSLEYRGRFGPP